MMDFRPIAGATLLSLTLAACGASSSNSCASKEDVAETVSALTDDLTKADSSGKLDRTKTADAMGHMLDATRTYETSHDRRAYCAALEKVRQSAGL